ncbi:MAG: hypothetical protein R2758_00650 [Bacteroidales bacterium]
MGGQERRETIYEGLINEGKYYLGYDEAQSIVHADANIDNYAALPWTENGPTGNHCSSGRGSYTSHEVSVAGGTDKIKYFSSLGYTDQKGISVMGFLKRFSGCFNLSYEATKRLTVGANLLFSNVEQSTNTRDSLSQPLLFGLQYRDSKRRPVPSDGSYAYDFPRNGTGRNLKAYADLNYQVETLPGPSILYMQAIRSLTTLSSGTMVSYDFNMVKETSLLIP